jgi:alkanesulfonate monooxygenase SsuD/methylene tetrahydromethanopterin reductase-like flavin-dependent oxidoreductase (luciferase family)
MGSGGRGMKIGIGLPNTIKGTPGRRLIEWARRAEERGFAGLATIDRIAYPNFDSLTTLAAVAGATERIGLMTNILIGPLYNPVHLAKVAASVDQLSGGRLTLGIAPGGRADDYAVLGLDYGTRGKDLDALLEQVHEIWSGKVPAGSNGEQVGPPVVNGERVPLVFGGSSAKAFERMARWGDGFTFGGVPANQVAPLVEQVRAAWAAAGRTGDPRICALAYYAIGADADEESSGYLLDYYAFLGDFAGMIVSSRLATVDAVREAVSAYGEAGVTELYLNTTTNRVEQVDRLADAVL